MKKILACQLILKNIHTRNMITKNNSCGSKFPSPTPHNFSNGPSLTGQVFLTGMHNLQIKLIT